MDRGLVEQAARAAGVEASATASALFALASLGDVHPVYASGGNEERAVACDPHMTFRFFARSKTGVEFARLRGRPFEPSSLAVDGDLRAVSASCVA